MHLLETNDASYHSGESILLKHFIEWISVWLNWAQPKSCRIKRMKWNVHLWQFQLKVAGQISWKAIWHMLRKINEMIHCTKDSMKTTCFSVFNHYFGSYRSPWQDSVRRALFSRYIMANCLEKKTGTQVNDLATNRNAKTCETEKNVIYKML